ncbi:MAG: TonB-dependent receptor [Bryobacterales bacterium]|nr:TonB-dependent receptor [Bryobacterales bacterium]
MRTNCLFALLLLCSSLHAQESRATLQGRVTDSTGAVIPGASVEVLSETTQVKQTTTTNATGAWTVRFLNPATYSVTISSDGFQTLVRRNIVLQTADSKQLDVALELGNLTQSVVVSAETPLIDTSASTAGTVIEGAAITEMPMLSRIPFLLATMSPGVMALDQNQNVAMMWSNNAASEFNVNGGRGTRANEFLIDGMPNTKRDRVAFIPPADSVAEFKIMQNAYDAQYGRQAGGTINVSVKSGTKDYHGGVYEFFRNSALNANLFQSNRSGQAKVPAHYNLWGGTFGGPVWIPKFYKDKNRTFFFVSYEGIRNSDPRFTTRSVPTEQERAGDFNGSFTTRVIGGVSERVPITIFDPLTIDGRRTIQDASGVTVANPNFGYRLPFTGNTIPRQRMSPVALNILKFVPLPNTPSLPTSNASSNFVPSSSRQNRMASIVTRVDHTWSNSHKSFASIRWNHMDELTGDDFANAATGGNLTRINRGLGVDHVWTMSSARILNVRFNITRFEEPSYSNGTGFNPADLGFPTRFVSQMEKLSFPRITNIFGDIGGGAGSTPMSTQSGLIANVTQVRSNFTFRYGLEYRLIQEADANFGNQSGEFSFESGGNWTRRRYDVGETGYGSTMATFLLGQPYSGSFPRNANRFDSMHYYALFLQTDWRATSRLTFNMGLRWDHERPFTERFNRQTVDYDPAVLNPISDAAQAAYTRILGDVLKDPVRYPFGPQVAQLMPADQFKVYGAQRFAGVDGQPVTSVNPRWNQWQPRIGFAYRLRDNTVLRGGFGRFVQGSGIKGGQNGFSRSTPFTASLDTRITAYDTLDNPFRDGILAPTGSSLGAMTNLGQGVNWNNRNAAPPYSWDYSLFLQHEWKGWLLEAGYSHNQTYNIPSDLQQNDIGFERWSTLRVPRFDAAGKPLARPFLSDEQIPNPFQGLPGVTGGRSTTQLISLYDLLRPIKILGGQSRANNPWGVNQYDALQAKVQRRFNKGFSVLAAYTFSKLFEDTSFWGPEISGPIAEHKLGGEDRPHKLSLAPIVEIPVGRGKKVGGSMPKVLDAVAGGWQISGQYTIQSGTPTVFGTDSFFDGQDFHLPRNERTLARWFATEHFVKFPNSADNLALFPAWTGVHSMPGANFQPQTSADPRNGAYADFGNYVRRYPTRWANVRNSRVNEVNFGLFKNFRIEERWKIQFRSEMFNTFNHPRFPGPDTNPGSANFGRVGEFQNNQARIIQLALKINF